MPMTFVNKQGMKQEGIVHLKFCVPMLNGMCLWSSYLLLKQLVTSMCLKI